MPTMVRMPVDELCAQGVQDARLAQRLSSLHVSLHIMHEHVDKEKLTVVSLLSQHPVRFLTRASRTPAKATAIRTVTGAGVGGESDMTQTEAMTLAPKPV